MKIPDQLTYASESDSLWKQRLIKLIEFLSGKRKIIRLIESLDESLVSSPELWSQALALLQVKVRIVSGNPANIPADGPIVFIANHPFGILDGLVICEMAARSRTTWKIPIHRDLARFPQLDRYFLPVDFRENREAVEQNIRTKREALEVLRQGGAIGIFPSGGIATAPYVFGKARELEWKSFVSRLVRIPGVCVIPVFFHGQNSLLFHFASRISMTLRLSLVIRELVRSQKKEIQISIGELVPWEKLAATGGRPEIIKFLQQTVEETGKAHPAP